MIPDSIHRSASAPVSASSRRTPKIAIALGVVALLAAVALLARGSGEDSGTPDARQAATPGSQPTGSGPANAAGHTGQGGRAEEKAPQFNKTTCWQDLEQFNDKVTLETFRAWAAPLLASRDPLVIDYLKARLAELIGNDEGRASEVLGWAREAPPAEFKLLMAGIRGSEALPKLAAQLTSLGLDESIDINRRAGFLDELQRMPRLEPAALDKLATFAKDASSGEAGWVTTRAIGRVMEADLVRTGNAKPYLDKLLTIGTESLDERVRYLALEMEMQSGVPLDKKSTEHLARLLATEGSEEVRQVVAHDLSFAEDEKQALDIYAKAFANEKDLCVRWALFRFAARAAGKDALPVMAEMAITDPRFQGDYQDFERLYASGILDFDRLWLSLPSDNPHGCLDRHE
ncbi:hypothetical protein JRI60_01880 [Archangium violaceum]|uniref:hypothetical protein n=1 Tax=Archangium violaceum TaxID=83451 RepID=UPI00194E4278|nr:hypothetical protein [Archangium violaceum]QRN97860.1 hypothetical protein JRI60_01880 [Archangium violaceum]